MEDLKRIFVAEFAPAARRWALVEGSRHVPRGGSLTSQRAPRGKRVRPRAIWRTAVAH